MSKLTVEEIIEIKKDINLLLDKYIDSMNIPSSNIHVNEKRVIEMICSYYKKLCDIHPIHYIEEEKIDESIFEREDFNSDSEGDIHLPKEIRVRDYDDETYDGHHTMYNYNEYDIPIVKATRANLPHTSRPQNKGKHSSGINLKYYPPSSSSSSNKIIEMLSSLESEIIDDSPTKIKNPSSHIDHSECYKYREHIHNEYEFDAIDDYDEPVYKLNHQ